MDSAKPIYKYLHKQNSQLVDVVTHSETINKVEKSIKHLINQHVEIEWRLGKLTKNEIVLMVGSAEAAHRLRYQSVRILQELRTLELCELINKIEIKVRPEIFSQRDETKTPTKPLTSSQGEKYIRVLANTLDDQPLKASLLRLAKHLNP